MNLTALNEPIGIVCANSSYICHNTVRGMAKLDLSPCNIAFFAGILLVSSLLVLLYALVFPKGSARKRRSRK